MATQVEGTDPTADQPEWMARIRDGLALARPSLPNGLCDTIKRREALRLNGQKPVRVTTKGRVYIGDKEFLYPIAEGSIKVERVDHRNLLTLTLVVGDVTMERAKPRATCSNPECRVTYYGPRGAMPTQCDHCGSPVEINP